MSGGSEAHWNTRRVGTASCFDAATVQAPWRDVAPCFSMDDQSPAMTDRASSISRAARGRALWSNRDRLPVRQQFVSSPLTATHDNTADRVD